ncbi:hypothetical protein OBBRIDRAFT_193023 [Obba rivulosa]|uniref:Uncharacterized protein n=1 Tax=Obba rivulosa TaxID=1052685 RepID=A0A8E2ALT4_9APHY|nr:hypothetical protein OBBRIDRAFT_193023 [Obba rivulosa]
MYLRSVHLECKRARFRRRKRTVRRRGRMHVIHIALRGCAGLCPCATVPDATLGLSCFAQFFFHLPLGGTSSDVYILSHDLFSQEAPDGGLGNVGTFLQILCLRLQPFI